MKVFGIGCTHGKLPDISDFLRKNKIETILSLGDHCNGDEVRDINFRNWERFKGRKYYEVMRELLDKEYLPTFQRFSESGKNILESLDQLGFPVLAVQGNNDFTKRDKERSQLDLVAYEDICKDISCRWREDDRKAAPRISL